MPSNQMRARGRVYPWLSTRICTCGTSDGCATSGCGSRRTPPSTGRSVSRTSQPLAATAGVDQAVLVQADDSATDTEAMFEVAAARNPRVFAKVSGLYPPGSSWTSGDLEEIAEFAFGLSVSEYVLLGEAGFEPLGFVVGSSIYHVGLQVGRWGQNQELVVLTQAMYNARELAMARMRAEADHLAADGIVGVQLRMQMYAWGQSCLEFVATGTAVRHLTGQGAHRAPDGRAFTSDLSAQDFFRLLAAGAVPVSFVLGTCVYHIAHQSVMQSLRQAGQNQEMLQFTQGVYEARELALNRMQAEAAQARSSGIVGVTVDVKNHVWGEHATEFLATGTAIRRLSDEHRLPETTPKPTFTLGLDN